MSSKAKSSSRSSTTTVDAGGGGLTAEEERLIRMKFGLAGDDELELPSKAEGNADVAAKLREMEKRAFAMTGRTPGEEAKSKIVSALRDKSRATAAVAKKPSKKSES